MIFMGQEFLEWGAWSDGTPLDWSKADRFSGIRTLYRDLIKLRRNGFGATRGLCGQGLHVHHVNNQDKVVGYHRWDVGGPRDDVVVIANFANGGFSPYKVGLPRGGVWRIRFNSDWGGYSPAFTNFGSFDLFATRKTSTICRLAARSELAPIRRWCCRRTHEANSPGITSKVALFLRHPRRADDADPSWASQQHLV